MKKLISQLVFLLVFCVLVIGFPSCNEGSEEKAETAKMPIAEVNGNLLNRLTKDIYGIELEYEFKDYVTIDLTFSSDTALYWIERTSRTDANEQINTIHLNEHTTLTAWIEHDKTIVSLYSNFSTGKTYGYQYFSNGRIRKLIGIIKLKQ